MTRFSWLPMGLLCGFALFLILTRGV